jgi:hypothetical protein
MKTATPTIRQLLQAIEINKYQIRSVGCYGEFGGTGMKLEAFHLESSGRQLEI